MKTIFVPATAYNGQVINQNGQLFKLTEPTGSWLTNMGNHLQSWNAIPLPSMHGIPTPRRELRNVRYSGPRNPLVRAL